MLYNLLAPLSDNYPILNLFNYLTFRTGGGVMTALMICFVIGPKIILWLKEKQKKGQPIRTDGPESHLITKVGTPTMGGIMILISLGLSTLLWADLTNPFIWVCLLVTLGYGIIGFLDDYLKVTQASSAGVSARVKMLLQSVLALVAAAIVAQHNGMGLAFPFVKDFVLNLGIFYVVFAAFIIVGFSNAVNLTDGLDGLATMPVIIACAAFALIAYLVGNAVYSSYLQVPFVRGAGELAVFTGAIIGACLGFLWFNAPPAMVFMGDTGSLALGGALGSVAVVTRHELVLLIIGGLFVLETVSVIVQVISFKLTGKRVFRMAPLHHHYEKKGWAEPTIVIRFWIIALILAMVGLSTLKLR